MSNGTSTGLGFVSQIISLWSVGRLLSWYLRDITFPQIGLYPTFNTRLLLKVTLLGSVLVMSLAVLCLFPLKIKHMVPCGEIRVICRHSNPLCAEMLNAWLFSMHLPFSSTAVSCSLRSVLSAWVMFSFLLLFDFRIKLQSKGLLGDLYFHLPIPINSRVLRRCALFIACCSYFVHISF